MASLVSVELKVLPANKDLLVFPDVLETKDLKETSELAVHPDLTDYPVLLDKPDHLDLLVNAVPSEKPVQWVLKAQLDLEANLVLTELKEKEEKEEKLEIRAPRVIAVFSVFKVFLVLWVLLETRVPSVLLDPLANLVNQVREDPLVVTEVMDLRVSWDPPVPVVAKVKLVNLVHLVLLVLLDLLDLLVNQWVMMLLLWLLSLDKARLRVPTLWLVTIRLVYSLN